MQEVCFMKWISWFYNLLWGDFFIPLSGKAIRCLNDYTSLPKDRR